MSDSAALASDLKTSDSSPVTLPISSIVRAVCEGASGGPDLLYEVMIKMSLMVEATAPTYGLSIWATSITGKPSLRWAEGLEEIEIAEGEAEIGKLIRVKVALYPPQRETNQSVCFSCLRPLGKEQRCMADVSAL